MRRRCAIDSNVLLYARGGPHPYRAPCRQIVEAAAAGEIELEGSAELLQEIAHVLRRRGVSPEAIADELTEVRVVVLLHPFDDDVVDQLVALLRSDAPGDVRDLVHAGTAFAHGLTEILTADRAFDTIDGLTRIDPIDVADELPA